MSYNWKEFTERSDCRYSNARQTGDFGALAAHNILASGEVELRFIADVVRSHGEREMMIGWGAALDVCCGSGYMSSCLANQGYCVRAFDMNSDAVQIARQTYPGIDFRVDDAVTPSREIATDSYDLILIREAHPFSRVRDDEFQLKLLRRYIDMLAPNGILAIGHASRGGGMTYPSMSFEVARETVSASGMLAYGPYFMFVYKHCRLRTPSRWVIRAVSAAASVIGRISNSRWIEYFIAQRL